MQVKSTVKMNMPRIKQLSQASIRALELTAEELHAEVVQAQVVPRRDGSLQGEKMFVDCSESRNGKAAIIHEGPYARRLYYHPEYHFRKDENPNAKGNWFEDWLPGGSKADFVAKAFRKFFKQLGGV